MSTDFMPATRLKPTEEQVTAFLADQPDLRIEGTWKGDDPAPVIPLLE